MIPEFEEAKVCKPHNNHFDSRCPKENSWILSDGVQIIHSKFRPQIKRTLYYRPTSSGCNCKQIYNGELDLFLLVNTSKSFQEKNKL